MKRTILLVAVAAVVITGALIAVSIYNQQAREPTPVQEPAEERVGVSNESSNEDSLALSDEVTVSVNRGSVTEGVEQDKRDQVRVEPKQPEPEPKASEPTPVQVECVPREGKVLPTGVDMSLSLSKSYGLAGTTVNVEALLKGTDESMIFRYSTLRFAWFSMDDARSRLTDWEESRITWDYADDGNGTVGVVGRASIYAKVPSLPPNTEVVMVACLLEKGTATSSKEVGYVASTFRVIEEEKQITYYRVSSVEEVYARVGEALKDRGIDGSEEAIKQLLDRVFVVDGEDRAITVKENSYLFIDASSGSLYILGCITQNLTVKDNDLLQCFFTSSTEDEYNIAIDVVYSDGTTHTVYDDVAGREFAYAFKHTISNGREGSVYVIARVNDVALLEIGIKKITKLDIKDLCVPWVDRDVSIILEPSYGLPASDVRAKIGIKILPEDESMRWMFEYITVTWLDDANRPIPTTWRYTESSGEELVSKWKDPLRIVRWDDGDDDIYTGSTEVMLNVPDVSVGSRLSLLVCFVHPMLDGYMDMVAKVVPFYVGSEMPKVEEQQQQQQQQQGQQQQQQQRPTGALPCSTLPGGDRQIEFIINPTSGAPGSSVMATLKVRVNPGDYGEPFDPTKHWRWMYESVNFFWLDQDNRIISQTGMMKVVSWSVDDPLYGEANVSLTVPSGSGRVTLLACFVHPMPGDPPYMEMTYRTREFTIEGSGAGGTIGNPGAGGGTGAGGGGGGGGGSNGIPGDNPIDTSRGSMNFDVGEICGKYTSRKDFIDLRLVPLSDGSVRAYAKVTLNANDPMLDIWKFMYSYLKFRWYNYSTNTYASEWIPSTPVQLIKDDAWTNENGKVVGIAEYALPVPSVQPGSMLGLIACFSHPWPGPTGYMDMNYTVAGYIAPSSYYTLTSRDMIGEVIGSVLRGNVSEEKANSIMGTVNSIKHRFSADARYLMLDVRSGSIYIMGCLLDEIPAEINDTIQCFAITDNSAVDRLVITAINADGTYVKKTYSMEDVGGNRISIANIRLDRAGEWMILGEFGTTAAIRVSVSLNVVPEGMLGPIAVIVSMMAIAVLYAMRRVKNTLS
ncbi:MAG: hypothetical protein NZ888_02060 [Candidatus Nitrosocaldus sp.]|nr:hypothetical protein [Candidatus Nitrosocaldus sp.]MDW7999968.1 hypothetical protein [Candidatus Nitrosocaldus sp.]